MYSHAVCARIKDNEDHINKVAGECVPNTWIRRQRCCLDLCQIVPSRQKPANRLIYLWKKANLNEMEQDIATFSRSFTTEHSETPINSL